MTGLLTMMAALAATAAQTMTAPGPNGALAGTFEDAGKGTPVVLIIPGSGPTDRDGNNRLGVAGAPYAQLAAGWRAEGVSSVRIDKRGMFGSSAAIPDANKVTIADYAADVHNWAKAIRQRTGARCVWVAGHSEGSLVALAAGQDPTDLCGIISISGMGRPFATVLRDQFRANGANAPLLQPALGAIASLEAGRPVDVAKLPAPLVPIFNPAVQAYEMDLMRYRPAALAASLKLPLLIVQGERDLQVSVDDAKALSAADPKAQLKLIPAMNHVFKDVQSDDRAANAATYADPKARIDPALVVAIANFVKR